MGRVEGAGKQLGIKMKFKSVLFGWARYMALSLWVLFGIATRGQNLLAQDWGGDRLVRSQGQDGVLRGHGDRHSIQGRAQDSFVQDLLDAVHLDSLVSSVRVLTGMEPARTALGEQTIVTRRYNMPTNVLAANWIGERLAAYGLEIEFQTFLDTVNVLGIQPGLDPDAPVVIIGAHYDAVGDTSYVVPGADDNASGTAAVLEAARILSPHSFLPTIVYALWDSEELGLWGSKIHARLLRAQGKEVRAVVNLDMVAWDGDGDGVVQIHADIPSRPLAEHIATLPDRFGLALDPMIVGGTDDRPRGIGASDHASFWNRGYPAVLLIEEYGTGHSSDFNPYYHSPDDRLEYFNLNYYRRMTQLAVAAVSTLALDALSVSIDLHRLAGGSLEVDGPFPNPATGSVSFIFSPDRPASVRLELFDGFGRRVAGRDETLLGAGRSRVTLDVDSLAAGPYVWRAVLDGKTSAGKLIKL